LYSENVVVFENKRQLEVVMQCNSLLYMMFCGLTCYMYKTKFSDPAYNQSIISFLVAIHSLIYPSWC